MSRLVYLRLSFMLHGFKVGDILLVERPGVKRLVCVGFYGSDIWAPLICYRERGQPPHTPAPHHHQLKVYKNTIPL